MIECKTNKQFKWIYTVDGNGLFYILLYNTKSFNVDNIFKIFEIIKDSMSLLEIQFD